MKKLSIQNLSKDSLEKEYKSEIKYTSNLQKLSIENLKISYDFYNSNLIQEIEKILDSKISIIDFVDCEIDFNDLGLNYQQLFFTNCKSTRKSRVKLGFDGHTKITVTDCDFKKTTFEISSVSLYIWSSELCTLNIYFDTDDKKFPLRILSIQGDSKICRIYGLESVLYEESKTVVDFGNSVEIKLDKSLTYRILKNIAIKLNDATQTQVFHNALLEISRKDTDRDSRFLLTLEKVTNNYGQSVILPILWMFVINIYFINLFYFSGNFKMENIFDLLASYLNINALHSFYKTDSLSWTTSIDSLRRLLLAILTYQTVMAARRFSFFKSSK